MMVDSEANQNRVEQFHELGRRRAEGTSVRVGVPIMLPFEDELLDKIIEDQGLETARRSHPEYQQRSTSLQPRFSEEGRPPLHVGRVSVDAPGATMPYSDHEQRRPANPSLRRKDAAHYSYSPPPITRTGIRRKSVTWEDQTAEI